jgi:hypothetical protein
LGERTRAGCRRAVHETVKEMLRGLRLGQPALVDFTLAFNGESD